MKTKAKIRQLFFACLVFTGIQTRAATCDLQNHVTLKTTFIPCNAYKFNLAFTSGYVPTFAQWSVDGHPVAGGLSSNQLTLTPGTHVICVNLMGGIGTETSELCCAKLCTTVTIPTVTTENRVVSYCPLQYPLGPWIQPCNECTGFYEFYKNGVYIGNSTTPGCISYILDAPAEIRCYDIFGGVKCLRKIIKLTTSARSVDGVASPTEYINKCGDSFVYTMNCGAGYPNYEFYTGSASTYSQGTMSPFGVSFLLGSGTYTANCVNYATCKVVTKTVQVSLTPYTESDCSTGLNNCDELSHVQDFLHCDYCKDIIMSATSMTSWTPLILIPGASGTRILQRIYYDDVNCRLCTVKVNMPNTIGGITPEITIDTQGLTCTSVSSAQLGNCMNGQPLHYVELNAQGQPVSAAIAVSAGSNFTLCCTNSALTNYYVCSDTDPCCFMLVHIKCDGGTPGFPAKHTSSQNQEPVFKLVPNPTSSVFRIEAGKADVIYEKIEVRDITGKVVLIKTNLDSKTYIDMSRFTKGTYMVDIKTKTTAATLKLITVSE